jgi:hypothetical protein
MVKVGNPTFLPRISAGVEALFVGYGTTVFGGG